MKKRKKIIIVCAAVLSVTLAALLTFFLSLNVTASRDDTYGKQGYERYYGRAQALAESYVNNFYDTNLRYLKAESNSFLKANCWSTSAFLSMCYKMALIDGDYLELCDDALYSIGFFRKEKNGKFLGYVGSSGIWYNGATNNDIYYDDNMWIGRDLVGLYNLTGRQKYLDEAILIADLIIEQGYVDLDSDMFTEKFGSKHEGAIGGFYWNYEHNCIHACSTAPAAQFLAALSKVADNGKSESYLNYAKATYNFVKYLENDKGVFNDLMSFYKDENNNITGIMGTDPAVYSYNSGSPITAAIELYTITGEAEYLTDASRFAKNAAAYFGRDSGSGKPKSFTDLVWFREILLNGYVALLPYDQSAREYIADMADSIDYAYENFRQKGLFGIHENFIPPLWTEGFKSYERYSVACLSALPNVAIYATLAACAGL